VLEFQAQPAPRWTVTRPSSTSAQRCAQSEAASNRGGLPARIDGTNRVYLAHVDADGLSEAAPCAKAP
jgi:hypothetical protein